MNIDENFEVGTSILKQKTNIKYIKLPEKKILQGQEAVENTIDYVSSQKYR